MKLIYISHHVTYGEQHMIVCAESIEALKEDIKSSVMKHTVYTEDAVNGRYLSDACPYGALFGFDDPDFWFPPVEGDEWHFFKFIELKKTPQSSILVEGGYQE